MILLDTNVLLALVDDRDSLHRVAAADLGRAKQPAFYVLDAVLTEAHFLLSHTSGRQRLRFLLENLRVRSLAMDETWWPDVFDWLEQYGEHEPDFADAQLVVLASRRRCRVWTYDREFRRIWRRIDGSRVPVYGAARGA